MVSLAKSSGALIFSCCHFPTRAFLAASSIFSRSQRRPFLATTTSTTTGLVTAGLILSFPSSIIAHCDKSSRSSSSSSSSSSTKRNNSMTGYLNAADAAALDADLMSTPGFSLEQLMELAGLSVAEAVYQVLPPKPKKPKILLVCGPGNNGGDGLVAARHLVHFGYDCVVVYPTKQQSSSKKQQQQQQQHFVNLVQQCKDMGVSILEEMPLDLNSYDGIVDAIFGFSFHGAAPREPFATALQQIRNAQNGKKKKILVISVDVPSGWNVDEGDIAGTGFLPDVLVSLTTPKESARKFQGRHFVGGRFLPPKLAEKYNIRMPLYPGVSQVMEVTNHFADNDDIAGESPSSSSTIQPGRRPCSSPAPASMGWEEEYAAYLQEKDQQPLTHIADDTDNVASLCSANVPRSQSPSMTNDNDLTWEQLYAEYCAEKEGRLAMEDGYKQAHERNEK